MLGLGLLELLDVASPLAVKRLIGVLVSPVGRLIANQTRPG